MALLAEWLEIGGFSLSTPGWTHVDLSALLDASDMRTSTRVIPGGSGVVAFKLRRTVSRRTVPMVIFGDVDGAGAAHLGGVRAGVELNVAAINQAVVAPPLTADGTRDAVLHLASGDMTAKVRCLTPLTLGAFGPGGYRATLDLEFPYGVFVPPGGVEPGGPPAPSTIEDGGSP